MGHQATPGEWNGQIDTESVPITGVRVGAGVGSGVGTGVGAGVGSGVGAVGSGVGTGDGAGTGTALGEGTGIIVGTSVVVGAEVGGQCIVAPPPSSPNILLMSQSMRTCQQSARENELANSNMPLMLVTADTFHELRWPLNVPAS